MIRIMTGATVMTNEPFEDGLNNVCKSPRMEDAQRLGNMFIQVQ